MNQSAPEPTVDFDIATWLKPVNVSRSQLRKIIHWSLVNEGKPTSKNVYSCAKGHRIVTVDLVPHEHEPILVCPTCGAEMRSWYYCCDQNLKPTHRYYEADEVLRMRLAPESAQLVLLGPVLRPHKADNSASSLIQQLKKKS